MSYKCLFIDLDDTLWDTYHNNKECLRELYAESNAAVCKTDTPSLVC